MRIWIMMPVFVALASFTNLTYADDSSKIEIRGFYLNKSKADIQYRWGTALYLHGFTMAGIPGKDPTKSNVVLDFVDDRLVYFMFTFDSKNFDDMLAATKNKYQKLSCKNSPTHNAMGAVYQQTECSLSSPEGKLFLKRFSGNIAESSISLVSPKAIEKMKAEKQKKMEDI